MKSEARIRKEIDGLERKRNYVFTPISTAIVVARKRALEWVLEDE